MGWPCVLGSGLSKQVQEEVGYQSPGLSWYPFAGELSSARVYT